MVIDELGLTGLQRKSFRDDTLHFLKKNLLAPEAEYLPSEIFQKLAYDFLEESAQKHFPDKQGASWTWPKDESELRPRVADIMLCQWDNQVDRDIRILPSQQKTKPRHEPRDDNRPTRGLKRAFFELS